MYHVRYYQMIEITHICATRIRSARGARAYLTIHNLRANFGPVDTCTEELQLFAAEYIKRNNLR